MRPLGWRILPLILLTTAAAHSQDPSVVNPAPQPPVDLPPVEVTAPAGRPENPDPFVHPPGEIDPIKVTAKHFLGTPDSKNGGNLIYDHPLFDAYRFHPRPFVAVPSGPLI